MHGTGYASSWARASLSNLALSNLVKSLPPNLRRTPCHHFLYAVYYFLYSIRYDFFGYNSIPNKASTFTKKLGLS